MALSSQTATKGKMKKQLITTICLALAASVSGLTAAETSTMDLGTVLSQDSATTAKKTEAIQNYVSKVEQNLPSYTRREKKMKGAFGGITEQHWEKAHGYYDGDILKRAKLYPAADSKKTEEFYFYNNQLVFAFLEENGAATEGHDKDADGDKYYFADGKLISGKMADGKKMDISGTTAKNVAARAQKEAQKLQQLLKK